MTQTPTARIALADTKPAAMVTDALVVALAPARGKKAEVIAPGLTAAARTKLAEAFTAVGATGKAGEVTRIPGGGGLKAPVVVGLGLGDAAKQADPEALRRAVGDAVRSLAGTRRIALALPLADDEALLTVSIAALMSAYDYVSFRSASKKDRKAPVHSITVLLPAAPTPEQKQAVKEVAVGRQRRQPDPRPRQHPAQRPAAVGARGGCSAGRRRPPRRRDDLGRARPRSATAAAASSPSARARPTRLGWRGWSTRPRARRGTSPSSARASPSTPAASRSSRPPTWTR